MLTRRRSIIYVSLCAFFLLAILALAVSTRLYRSMGEIEVQKESTSALGIQTDSADTPSDALEVNMIIQTQAQILQSDSLALHVIEDLHLEQTEDYQSKWSPLGWLFGLFAPRGVADSPGATLENSPHRRMRVLKTFHRRLAVKPVAGTRLIDVAYLSPDPQLAAAVVNHLLQGLIEKGYQARYDATMQASSWLSGQLGELRAKTQELQAKTVKLQQESGVFALGEVDREGRDQVYSPTLEKLQMATQAEAQAQSNRILKGAINDVVKSGNAELISGLGGSAMSGGSSAAVATSLSLIQNLRLQEATLEGQLQELSAKFGPAYPKLAELRGNLTAVQAAIQAEVGRVAGRAHNDFMVAEQTEEKTRRDFNADKSEAEALNNKTIEYQMVRQEADQTRSLYDDMLRHLKESGLLAGLHSTNISIVDWAKASDSPAKPVVLLYAIGSLLAGLVFGIVAALLRDVTDTRIHDVREISRELGPLPLCVLPYQKEPAALHGGVSVDGKIAHGRLDSPHSPLVESLRSLRTSLMLSRSGAPPRSVLVTSPLSGEGKSLLSWNLAILVAQQKKACPAVRCELSPTVSPSQPEDRAARLDSAACSPASSSRRRRGHPSASKFPGSLSFPRDPCLPTLRSCWRRVKWRTLLEALGVAIRSRAVWTRRRFCSLLTRSCSAPWSTPSCSWPGMAKTPLPALEKSYRMLEDVQSTSGRKINIVVNGVKEQLAQGFVPYPQREREAVKA